ncbi:uncharacterized protein V6R79_003368 [Siganus canaliculatus]
MASGVLHKVKRFHQRHVCVPVRVQDKGEASEHREQENREEVDRWEDEAQTGSRTTASAARGGGGGGGRRRG